jgi:hypothetical protein
VAAANPLGVTVLGSKRWDREPVVGCRLDGRATRVGCRWTVELVDQPGLSGAGASLAAARSTALARAAARFGVGPDDLTVDIVDVQERGDLRLVAT